MAKATLLAGFAVFALVCAALPDHGNAAADDNPPERMTCEEEGYNGRRLVCADVAAFEQMIVYNRFGSFNPFGMMFALKRDLSQADLVPDKLPDADVCDEKLGTEAGVGRLEPGKVRLKDCKRPRPLVLRANANDVLKVRLTNYLAPGQPGFSQTFCRNGNANIDHKAFLDGEFVSRGDEFQVGHDEAACRNDDNASPGPVPPNDDDADWPKTRGVSFAVQGLQAIPGTGEKAPDRRCLGQAPVAPGEYVDCYYDADVEGTYFLSSKAAPAGGQGDGGSITHGLFGAIVVEPRGSKWYRSQVSRATFDKAWPPCEAGVAGCLPGRHARAGAINYESVDNAGIKLLNLVQEEGLSAEIIHTDLNAIIFRDGNTGCALEKADAGCRLSYREFSVFFHDELKTFYTKNFEELDKFGQLAGVRDGFAINYGASGMGAMLLANRKGIGPAADCVECLYEEFFLASWANGDPALLEQYSDDPSNVHHSYLNDRVVFRNFHAGPKETHVFHLHAHQWFAGNDPNRGAYLDSQTVGPEQGFTYDIYHGGLPNHSPKDPNAKGKGWWQSLGAGNRNRSPGDSIFHCHLYPHFAQGMWELWRNHDVLEDGTRKLPDGQSKPGMSIAFNDDFVAGKTVRHVRKGNVDKDGRWIGESTKEHGTPVPAIVPMPDQPLPLLPSYTTDTSALGMPGYPFYVAAEPGHRPPQAPLDIANDGGLPRHRIASGERIFAVGEPPKVDPKMPEWRQTMQQYVAKVLSLGDFTAEFHKLEIQKLANDGEPLERAAMGFHHDGAESRDKQPLKLTKADGTGSKFEHEEGGYRTNATPLPSGALNPKLPPGRFYAVNGAPPKPGAPFADPCAVADGVQGTAIKPDDPFVPGTKIERDPGLTGFRRYEASAVQLDLVTNRAGWHDPQARINVLTKRSGEYKPGGERAVSGQEEPFFFRAFSGECIEFRHTNELPKDLDLDDFQVKTPTDTIGQHIHLVKFDVMAADGSGNGFNYEDGTFAPDEVVARVCAATGNEFDAAKAKFCKPDGHGGLEPQRKDFFNAILDSKTRENLPFQTTIQRWYADPILSPVAAGSARTEDRTMRTVFTHDHFGPSSIQQHGFYSALVIEPTEAKVCEKGGNDNDLDKPGQATNCRSRLGKNESGTPEPDFTLQEGDDNDKLVGVHKRILDGGPLHGNYREFMLAIADFATLYDPQDFEDEAALDAAYPLPHGDAGKAKTRSPKGMEKLLCEAVFRANPQALKEACGSELNVIGNGKRAEPGTEWIPAWVAGGRKGDSEKSHESEDLLVDSASQIAMLKTRLIEHRKAAAGCAAGDATCRRLAKPVAPPERPESISVDHHDPYLVNYRGEPIPLRVGQDRSKGKACDLRANPQDWVADKGQRIDKAEAECSVNAQRPGIDGDMANVFLSSVHGDPATPVVNAYNGERVIFRMIQGAQEVQHVFNIDGYSFTRNIDQSFPAGNRPLEHKDNADKTLHSECIEKSRDGRPLEVRDWFKNPNDTSIDSKYWREYEQRVAVCDNADGRATAQEIGISEHFEIQGQFRKEAPGVERVTTDAVALKKDATDYLYHFGSSDDLWNGAWGLLRVYANKKVLDLGQCEPGATGAKCQALSFYDPRCSVDNDRLICPETVHKAWKCEGRESKLLCAAGSPNFSGCHINKSNQLDCGLEALRNSISKVISPVLPDRKEEAEREAVDTAAFEDNDLLCRPGAPELFVAAVAVSNEDVWPKASHYGSTLRDPDGLSLVLLTQDDLGAQGDLDDWKAFWRGGVETSKLRALAAEKLKQRPLPFTLDVPANRCVHLAIVNALTPDTGTGLAFEVLKDRLGDALMPPVTPLNTDPPQEDPHDDKKEIRFVTKNGQRDSVNLRPSARLAMRLQLPVLNDAQTVGLPYGWNTTGALAPAEGRVQLATPEEMSEQLATPEAVTDLRGFSPRGASVELLTFFTGRVRLPDPWDDDELTALGKLACEKMTAAEETFGDVKLVFRLPEENSTCVAASAGDRETKILGRDVEVEVFPAKVNPDGTLSRIAAKIFLSKFAASPMAHEVQQLGLTDAQADAFYNKASEIWKKAAKEAVAENAHWVPYAFGPIPLKPVGDVIGHPTHGLFGVVNVVPENWAPSVDELAAQQTHVPTSAFESCVTDPTSGDRSCQPVRQFTLMLQDGLNLHDSASRLRPTDENGSHLKDRDSQGALVNIRPVPDCKVCDDSYDFGERGVNYHAQAMGISLRNMGVTCPPAGGRQIEANTDLNICKFPADFYDKALKQGAVNLVACAGEEITIRVAHPGGRQRQHSFTTIGFDYFDLFPGFGFPHSALLGPGKTVTTSLTRKAVPGRYLWMDGTATLRDGGIWGFLTVKEEGDPACVKD